MLLLKSLSKIFSNLIFWHILLWVLCFALFTFSFFEPLFREGKANWYFLINGLNYGFYLMAAVYVNYLILIPRYAAQKKIVKYVFLVVAVAIGFGFLFALTFYTLIGTNVSSVALGAFIVLEFVFIIITSFFKYFKDWISNIGLKVSLLEIEKQKVEAELDTLKSQLNPHFLFNVLNSIYSHSLLKSDVAPSIVIKLSDLMSYILYDCKTKTVPLQKDIEFLNNYIELEKIRVEEDIDIVMDVIADERIDVPPLLFFPLLENAFKHGIGSHPQIRRIVMKIELEGNRLLFQIENSKGNLPKGLYYKKKGGIGIENIRKRLNLLYPSTHTMVVTENEESFLVEIQIDDIKLIS